MKKSAPPIKVSTLFNTSNYSPLFIILHYKFSRLQNSNHCDYVLINVILLINILLIIACLAMIGGVL